MKKTLAVIGIIVYILFVGFWYVAANTEVFCVTTTDEGHLALESGTLDSLIVHGYLDDILRADHAEFTIFESHS